MAFTIEQDVTINRPIAEVWDYVVEHDDWRRPFVLSVRKLTNGPHDVGSRYENSVKIGFKSGTVVNELTAFNPPTRMSWTQPERHGPVSVIAGSYLLESLGETQSRFTLTNTYEPMGVFRLLAPIARHQVATKVYPQLLRQLKENIENR